MENNDRLYSTLCSKEFLYNAWLRVKEKDTAGGLDFQSVQDFMVNSEKNIEDLSSLLSLGKYMQQPYKEVFIPKNENEKRRLGLLTVSDKIVQTAVNMLLTPILEHSFLKVSYAYRENKGPVKAIRQVRHLITNERFNWLVSCDIDNFFDTIPHEPLFRRLNSFIQSPGIIELIKMFVTMGRVNFRKQWKDNKQGIPQGGVISPLLANFFLYPLDKTMTENKYGFVRYADDFIILAHSEDDAKKAMDSAINLLTKQLQLNLNPGAEVVHVSKGFEFLGIYFKDGIISLSEHKYNRLIEKMAEGAGTGQGLITKKLRDTIQGIAAFYGKLVPQEQLSKLDAQLVSILKFRYESLYIHKADNRVLLTDLQSLQFLATENNINKTSFVQSLLEVKVKAPNKNKSIKQRIIKSRNAVLMRKHEYQKIESSGFDLILSQPGIIIGKKEKSIEVRKKGVVIKEIPFLNLRNITLLSDGISITSNLIRECCDSKIALHFLDHHGMPYAQLISPLFFDAEIAIAQTNAYLNKKCFSLIRQFISGKINNQLNLMKYFGKYHIKKNPEFAASFTEFENNMDKCLNQLDQKENCALDDYRLKIFAIEGQASSKYWEYVIVLLGNKAEFRGRERQGATDLVNCMLNYGYGILYSRISDSIIKARLNPCLSYLHKPESNRPSLVYDLIEEFRQQSVDRVVFSMLIKNKNLKAENGLLDEFTRRILAQKVIERLNNYEKFRNKEMRLSEIIQFQADSLAKYLTDMEKIYKPYIAKW